MKHVVIVVPDGKTNLASLTGAFDILNSANSYWQRMGNRPMIETRIAGFVNKLELNKGYFSIHPTNITEIKKTDLVIIPSVWYDDFLLKENKELIEWIKEKHKSGAEIATMCTGAFLLAGTGLLEGKTCSTHWKVEDKFRKVFPNINLNVAQLITSDDGIYTNGGAYSFLNLILFLVEKYFDRETAIYCSKIFEIDMDRNTQSPFFIFQSMKNHDDELIHKAQAYIEDHMTEKFSFKDLASNLATSRRNFDRRFFKATGNTPVEYLQRVKVEVAKKNLEQGRKSIFEIMNEVGYSDDKAFREVFKKIAGLSPLGYRSKYNKEFISVAN